MPFAPRTLVLATLIAVLSGCANVDQLTQNLQQRWEQRNLSEAEVLYLQGLKLSAGKEEKADHPGAMRAFAAAAKQGNAGAQYMLGMGYYVGRGVDQDFGRALAWLQKAAEQGHDGAQYFVGDIYLNGRSVARERSWGVQWFDRAAAKGNRQAQFGLGVAYAGGMGVKADLERGWFWLWLAHRAGEQQAGTLLDKLRPRLPQTRRAAIERQAGRWRPETVEAAPHPALVRFVQAQLNRQGFDAGAADGLVGPKTRGAIRAYRSNRSLGTAGGINDALIRQLRTEAR